MAIQKNEKPALLIIDMVKDNFIESKKLPITPFAVNIIAPLNRLIRVFRKHQWPVVFSTDAFRREDFIFRSQMHPHSLAGTEGAEVVDELDKTDDDLWLPKPKFSAFFLLEDCSAASSREVHEQTLSCYRRNPLYPLLKVAASSELEAEFVE
jgi:nicotinamidase/pyrazinamidase